ncbi:D-arabinono-1,4-lactone oxidase [Cytobacillus kochii]|uniref:D-arabinono-1,4-lactone oxidase n=1 Tax=Cytobacillus kochii TaxID=859143 RepID=UPI002E1F4BFF|nr:D-arabinono-1,4-lactone oxidase [Cytobacillus kochii]MED1606603.1 D-arabinono-1,4-lactone oxidase [Cytobacillus kochii]
MRKTSLASIRNWAENVQFNAEQLFFPQSIEDVIKVINNARKEKKKIRVVGSGHSFTNLIQTEEWFVSLDRLSGMIFFDEDQGLVEVYGGTKLYEIGKYLGEKGWAQENLGDINTQSIAGAISTGTHGTGMKFGNISTQVEELVMITAGGEELLISRQVNSQLYDASLVSLGLLGIVVKVKLKVIQAPTYVYKSRKILYSDLKSHISLYIQHNRHFECFLFPFSNHVQIKTMNITDKKPRKRKWRKMESMIMENYIFGFLSVLCRKWPNLTKPVSRISAKAISDSEQYAPSYDLFATPRKVKFVEMEYAIPLEHMVACLDEIRKKIEEQQYKVHFPIECRVVKRDNIWLSPSFGRDSAYIAFHMFKGMPYETYFNDMEAIMNKYNGRPHWGKIHQAKLSELTRKYSHLREFLIWRAKLDPNHLFVNPYLAKLFHIEKSNMYGKETMTEKP